MRYCLLSLILLLPAMPAAAQLQIFACEPEWAALSKALGGDQVEIYSATHAGQDPHQVQARPSLIARLRKADLAVCTGAELEAGWLPVLQRRARNPDVLPGQPGFFTAADQVFLLGHPESLDRAEGHIHAAGNPHIQLDPRRIQKVARALSQRLQLLDTTNIPTYQQRLQDFEQRWQMAMTDWQQKGDILRGKRAIVHHQEWLYLLDWLGVEQIATLEPKPGIPPSLKHLEGLTRLSPADWILVSPLNDDRPANWLAQHSGAQVVVLPHTVGATPASEDLFQLFDQIITLLTGTNP